LPHPIEQCSSFGDLDEKVLVTDEKRATSELCLCSIAAPQRLSGNFVEQCRSFTYTHSHTHTCDPELYQPHNPVHAGKPVL
jgi:hypothetical protein